MKPGVEYIFFTNWVVFSLKIKDLKTRTESGCYKSVHYTQKKNQKKKRKSVICVQ